MKTKRTSRDPNVVISNMGPAFYSHKKTQINCQSLWRHGANTNTLTSHSIGVSTCRVCIWHDCPRGSATLDSLMTVGCSLTFRGWALSAVAHCEGIGLFWISQLLFLCGRPSERKEVRGQEHATWRPFYRASICLEFSSRAMTPTI